MKKITYAITVVVSSFLGISSFSQQTTTYSDQEILAGRPCYFELNSNPKLTRLLPKVGAIQTEKGYRAPIELLADKTKPNKEDKAAIGFWAKERQDCDQKAQAFLQAKTSPGNYAVRQSVDSRYYALLARLYAGDLSFGEFVQNRQDLNQSLSAQLREVSESEKVLRNAEMLKANEEARAQAARKESELARGAADRTRQRNLEAERQANLAELEQKHTANSRRREARGNNLLNNVDCLAASLLGGNCLDYRRREDKINDYSETQEMEWVKGNITARSYVSSVRSFHQNFIQLDTYTTEGYLFEEKVAGLFDAGKMSISDARYLMEKNSNQIAERRQARQPVASIQFTCTSSSLGGVFTTNCR